MEILAAQFNCASLLVLACFIVYAAIHRLVTPPEVRGGLILAVALIGKAIGNELVQLEMPEQHERRAVT